MITESSLTKGFKEVIYCLYDNNMNRRVEPIGIIRANGLKQEKVEFLYKLVDTLIKYNCISGYTIMYLENRDITISSVMERLNEQGKKVNYNNVASKIMYDKKRLESMFGSEMISDIVYRGKEIKDYEKIVDRLIAKEINRAASRDYLVINIRDDVLQSYYNGDFKAECEKLIAYTKVRKEQVEKEVYENVDFSGYFNYLMNTEETKSEREKEDREYLRDLVNGKEIIVEQREVREETEQGLGISEIANEVYQREMRTKYGMELSRKITEDIVAGALKEHLAIATDGDTQVIVAPKFIVAVNNGKNYNFDKLPKYKKLLSIEMEEIDSNLVNVVAESKRECIREGIKYTEKLESINTREFKLQYVEIVVKAVLCGNNNDKVYYSEGMIKVTSDIGSGLIVAERG